MDIISDPTRGTKKMESDKKIKQKKPEEKNKKKEEGKGTGREVEEKVVASTSHALRSRRGSAATIESLRAGVREVPVNGMNVAPATTPPTTPGGTRRAQTARRGGKSAAPGRDSSVGSSAGQAGSSSGGVAGRKRPRSKTPPGQQCEVEGVDAGLSVGISRPRLLGSRLGGSLVDLAKIAREDDPHCGTVKLGRPATSGLYTEFAQHKKRAAEAIQQEADAVMAAKIAEMTPLPLAERFAGPFLHKGDELGPLSKDSVEALVVHVGRAIGTLEEVRTKSTNLKGTLAGSMKVCEHNLRVAAEELARRLRASGDPGWHEERAIILQRELEGSRAQTGALQRRVAALEAAMARTGVPGVGQDAPPAETGEGREASGGLAVPASPGRAPQGGRSSSPTVGRMRSGGRREGGTGDGALVAAAGGEGDLKALVAAAVATGIESLREDFRREMFRWWERQETEVRDEVVPSGPRHRRGQEGAAATTAVLGGSAVERSTPMDVEVLSRAAKRKAEADRGGRPAGASEKRRAGEVAGEEKKEGNGKRKKKKAAPPPPSQTAAESTPRLEPAPPPPPRKGEWAKVVGRKAKAAATKKAAAAKPPLANTSGGAGKTATKGQEGGKGQKGQKAQPKKPRPARPPRMVAITLTAVGEGEGALAKAMAKVRRELVLEDFGIAELRPKRAMTGGLVLEVPGPEGAPKADKLARRMEEVLEGTDVRVARPRKSGEVRLHGLDDSVTEDEARDALAAAGGCPAEDIRVGKIRPSSAGLGSIWAQLPLVAVRKLASGGKVRVGWVAARVEVLAARPIQCYRCLEIGHTRLRCTSDVDRSGKCYRCGQSGHRASECSAGPKCPLCTDLGRPAEHRLGAPSCAPAKKRRGPAQVPSAGQRAPSKVTGPVAAGSGDRVPESVAAEQSSPPPTGGEGAVEEGRGGAMEIAE